MMGLRNRVRRREVETGGIAHGTFHQLQEQRQRQIVQQQAADHGVDSAVVLQSGGDRDPHSSRDSARGGHNRETDDWRHRLRGQARGCCSQATDDERAFVADRQDSRAGRQHGAQRAQHERRGAQQAVLQGIPTPETGFINGCVRRRSGSRPRRTKHSEHDRGREQAAAGIATDSDARECGVPRNARRTRSLTIDREVDPFISRSPALECLRAASSCRPASDLQS